MPQSPGFLASSVVIASLMVVGCACFRHTLGRLEKSLDFAFFQTGRVFPTYQHQRQNFPGRRSRIKPSTRVPKRGAGAGAAVSLFKAGGLSLPAPMEPDC